MVRLAKLGQKKVAATPMRDLHSPFLSAVQDAQGTGTENGLTTTMSSLARNVRANPLKPLEHRPNHFSIASVSKGLAIKNMEKRTTRRAVKRSELQQRWQRLRRTSLFSKPNEEMLIAAATPKAQAEDPTPMIKCKICDTLLSDKELQHNERHNVSRAKQRCFICENDMDAHAKMVARITQEKREEATAAAKTIGFAFESTLPTDIQPLCETQATRLARIKIEAEEHDAAIERSKAEASVYKRMFDRKKKKAHDIHDAFKEMHLERTLMAKLQKNLAKTKSAKAKARIVAEG
jgi:hypothetical protein